VIPTEMTKAGVIEANLILLNEDKEQVIVSKNLTFISDNSTVTDLAQEVNNKIDDFIKLLLENMPQVMRSELNDLHAQTDSNKSNIELKANLADVTSLQNAMTKLQNEIETFGITPENSVTIKSLLDEITGILSDLNQKGIDITNLRSKIDEVQLQLADISPLKNKKIVMFGDSIIDLGTIPSEIKTLSGATEVYNVGFAGCTMTPTDTIRGGYGKFSMHALATAISANDFTAQTALATTTLGKFLAHLNTLKAIDFATIDICFISYGTNDFGFNVNPGTSDVVSNLTVAGAMKEIVNKLQSKNPNMEIIFTTPIYRADKFLNTLNLPLSVYADTIKGTAGRLATKVIDLHTCSGINEFNYTTLLNTADKLHPVAAGNTLMAKSFVKYARGGYVGRTDNKFEPLTVGMNLAQDSEKFNVHNPNNVGAFYGGKSYITHAPKSYMKYADIVLCDCMIELTGLTTIKIVFDAIVKGCQGRVDAILYDSANTAVASKTATLNINSTEANYVTNHMMGNFTGVYRLYVAIKAMDVAPEIYIRNPLILQKNYEKISVGATTVTVSGSPFSVTKAVVYKDYNNWSVDYIPVVMANSQYTDLIVSVANFYNHFEVTITTKTGVALTAGDYVINYVRFLP
ncbi:GDSL-type esterase/lipase family protein, partial [Ruminococcus sp.]|uniref:GDSL-type esterase/lipase family protein n=1 Tax=Ruminococcus sp. TaxID=41978 RepID=UPI003AB455AE